MRDDSDGLGRPSSGVAERTEYTGQPGVRILSMREALNGVLRQRLATDDRVFLYGQDIEDPKGDVFGVTRGLSRQFPGRVVNSPLSESTIVGTCIGRALAGQRPVAFIQFADFLPLAFNQIASELASMHWRTNGGWQCPVIVMVTCGGYKPGLGPFHSQTLESIAAHTPGIDVVMPSTSGDTAGLLNAAFESARPTLFFYLKSCLNLADRATSADVDRHFVPLGRARRIQVHAAASVGNALCGVPPRADGLSIGDSRNATEGVPYRACSLTLVTWGNTVEQCQRAAEALATAGVETELFDLRSLSPWDEAAVIASAERTGRLVVVHEDNHTCGFGAEVAATVAEKAAKPIRIRRVARPDTFVPCHFGNQLEILPSFKRVLETSADLLGLSVEWPSEIADDPDTGVIRATGSGPADDRVEVVEVRVAVGERVSKGQVVAIVEAAKSVVDVLSDISGTVVEVLALPGDRIAVGQPLVRVRLAPEDGLPSPSRRSQPSTRMHERPGVPILRAMSSFAERRRQTGTDLCSSAETRSVSEEECAAPALDAARLGPHPPRADGEPDGELETARSTGNEDPIQLAWMVNEISSPPQSSSPSAQGGWGREVAAGSRLADHLLHHPGKLDGADGADSLTVQVCGVGVPPAHSNAGETPTPQANSACHAETSVGRPSRPSPSTDGLAGRPTVSSTQTRSASEEASASASLALRVGISPAAERNGASRSTIFASRPACALGSRIVTTAEIAAKIPGWTAAEAIKRTGVERRHWIAEGETAVSLATKAATQLIDSLGATTPKISAILCSTTSPQEATPSVSCQVRTNLRDRDCFAEGCFALDLNAACSGFLYGLRLAYDHLQGDTAGSVLLLTSEVISPQIGNFDPATAFLFGDAASATLVCKTVQPNCGLELSRPWLVAAPDPDSTIRLPCHGSGGFLQMNGIAVARTAYKFMADALRASARQNSLGPADLAAILPHPGSIRILQNVAELSEIDESKVCHTLGDTGNTSSSSIPLALDRFWNHLPPDKYIGMAAFGAGFTSAAAIGKYRENPIHE